MLKTDTWPESICTADVDAPYQLRIRAQGSELGRGIRQADESIRSCLLLTVKWRRLSRIEATRLGVCRLVEPEANVERMGRQEARGWIEPEDLIEQDGFDRYFSFTVAVRFDVGLVPGQAKVLEIRVDSSFSQQIAVLNREEVECQVWNQVVNLQNQGVIESAPLDDHLGPKVFGHKGIDKPQRFPGARARRLSRCAGRRQAKD